MATSRDNAAEDSTLDLETPSLIRDNERATNMRVASCKLQTYLDEIIGGVQHRYLGCSCPMT